MTPPPLRASPDDACIATGGVLLRALRRPDRLGPSGGRTREEAGRGTG